MRDDGYAVILIEVTFLWGLFMADQMQDGGADDLQFSAVESATPGQTVAAPQCVVCHRPINDAYFTAGDKVVCPDCRNRYEATLRGGSGFWRFVKATALGIAAGIVGAAVWFGITYATDRILAIVSIGVGLLVGVAVRVGSEKRGGIGYQFLAVVLTYLALGVGLAPKLIMDIYEKHKADHPSLATSGGSRAVASTQDSATTRQSATTQQSASSATASGAFDDDDADNAPPKRLAGKGLAIAIIAAVVLVVGVVLLAPIGVAFGSIIGVVIIGIALWEAWRINRSRRLSLAGPFSLAGRPLMDPPSLPPTAPGPR